MTFSGNVPKLIAIFGLAAGQIFELRRRNDHRARRGECHPHRRPSLSRKHCARRQENGGWTICDMGSVNGTLVNGERVAERPLADSDRIAIGRTELLVRQDSELDRNAATLDVTATVTLELEDTLYLHARMDEDSAC
jgi:pSer/pThr/pTyr-binding forkhead associated (FHA) protein